MFVETSKFTEPSISFSPGNAGGKLHHGHRTPQVFSERGRLGLLAQVGELFEGGMVLVT